MTHRLHLDHSGDKISPVSAPQAQRSKAHGLVLIALLRGFLPRDLGA